MGLRHDVLLYRDDDTYVAGAQQYIYDGLAAAEPVLVVVAPERIDLLRRALGADADRVAFADMREIGTNPACIIPAWRAFVAPHLAAGRRPRGIGEPIWPGRTAAEIAEAQLHEVLLDVAFADDPEWDLLCPYDEAALDRDVIVTAVQDHRCGRHDHRERAADLFAAPLPSSAEPLARHCFVAGPLDDLRRFVRGWTHAAELDEEHAADFVVAVNEVATNSILHGGGRGEASVWMDGDALVCEVRDGGAIRDPLVGRGRPAHDQVGGRGLWLVNRLCDLVEIRSNGRGSTVRLTARRRARPDALRS